MSNGANPAAESVPQNAEPSGWQDHAVAITVAAAAGALVLGTVLYFSGYFDSGDEPPIRVKNGSVEFQLVTNSRRWRDDGNVKRWRISGGTRGKDQLDVTIAVNAGANCTSQAKSGNDLTVNYSDGTKIDIKSNGRRTRLVSTADLSLVGTNQRMLKYTGTGYISSVTLDGSSMCTFTDKAQFADLVISDY